VTPSRQSISPRAAADRNSGALSRAVPIIYRLCGLSGSLSLLDDIQFGARRHGIGDAIRSNNTGRIFDWLLEAFSYQGISDQVARGYLAKHGGATWRSIGAGLASAPSCPKLRNYRHFDQCRYDKGSFSCSEPEHIETCPLPRHRLRNGRLNQTAYSFFLFVRELADGDLVGWIDKQLVEATGSRGSPGAGSIEALIGPLRHVYGLSDKILTMALSELLLAAPEARPAWFEVGKNMIVIDTLVHNLLHRTGILDDFDANHGYGPACYAAGGCADIIRAVSAQINASTFNRSFPRDFPRFVQHAIWRYCAADGLNICNGNQIDDRKPCEMSFCQLFRICRKRPLKNTIISDSYAEF
jgi:hypothetical protein